MDGWIDTGDMLCEETVGEMIGMTDSADRWIDAWMDGWMDG